MLRLSKLTDYATVILSHMAREPAQIYAAMEIADVTGIMPPTVSKVLKILVKEKVLSSVRGAHGGYRLAHQPHEISVATVIRALEGPIALTECSIAHDTCRQASACGLRANWGVINQTIQRALEAVTLADMLAPVEATPQEITIPVSNLYR